MSTPILIPVSAYEAYDVTGNNEGIQNAERPEKKMMEARNGSQLYVIFDPQTGVWTSPNSCSLLTPIPTEEVPPLSAFYRQCRKPRWLFERYPFLAFWPLQIRWEGPIFERLNIPPTWDGIQDCLTPFHGYRYAMKPNLMEGWKRLEWALKAVAFHLIRSLNLKHQADLGHIMLPEECGYQRTHSTRKFARMAAFRSRDAFIALTTFLSFAIALHTAKEQNNQHQPDAVAPQWVKLLQDHKIHPVWIDDLRKSFVCDFMPSFRPGAYVKAHITGCGPFFEAFRAANVPIWIFWGFDPPVSMIDSEGMLPYRPTAREVCVAKERALRSTTTVSDSHAPPSPSYFAPAFPSSGTTGSESSTMSRIPAPKPERGSLQREKEDAETFRARIMSERTQYLASLSKRDLDGLQKLHELAREQNNDPDLPMPSIGSSLYQWVFYPGGYFRREMVSKRCWKDEWQRRSPEARHFYDFLDQWDLDVAEAMDDEDASGSDESDSSDGEEPSPDPIIQTFETGSGSSALAATITEEDVQHRYGNSFALASEVQCLSPTHLFEVRYGFSVCLPYEQDKRFIPTGDSNGVTNNTASALERLGLKEHRGPAIETAALDLYNFVVSHGTNAMAFPPYFESFRPSRSSIISSHSYFSYRRIKPDAHIIGVKGRPFREQWYLLAVRSPATVCQLFRESMDSVLGMVRYLLSKGIPFATVRCLSSAPSARHEPRPRLGFRRQGHVFDAVDYVAYEETKNDLLKSSVGRAALMRGGIVWRLANGVVPVKSVTKGPNPNVKEDGHLWGLMDQYRLVDDSLSLRDEDVICGMYYVETNPNQYEQRSWWPQSNTWETCGYNLGYWTLDCERWYEKRLKDIQDGTATLHNATQWRKILRRRPGLTKQFCDGVDGLSDLFLQGRFDYWEEN